MRFFVAALLASLVLGGCSGTVPGESRTGRLHLTFADPARANWQDDGPRPIAATVWYPAAADSVETPWSAGVFRFGAGALDAPFAGSGTYPLIVVSHGTGGSAAQLSWLAERLVDAGFVVAGVSHHGNTAAEGTTAPAGFVLPGERARDLSVLLDQLLVDPRLAKHIDATRIGAAGFSLGGYSVLASAGAHLTLDDWKARCRNRADDPPCSLPPEADFSLADLESLVDDSPAFKAGIERGRLSVDDPRIRAVYAIAPALVTLFDATTASSIRVPVRVVLAGQDRQIDAATTTDAIRTHLPTASVMRIAHAGHYAFLAPCTLRGKLMVGALCRDAMRVDRDQVHASVGQDAAAFFTQNMSPR